MAGFSHEVGALFAGVSLAGLPYAQEIAAKLKPLRDFFIVIFFVTLGESFTINSLQQNIIPALILAVVVIVTKPLLTMVTLSLQGYTRLTAFKAATHLSQISEFSIIFVTIVAAKDLISPEIVSLVTLIAFITIGLSSYLMKHTNGLYKALEEPLKRLERKNVKDKHHRQVIYSAVLIGYHKGGYEYIKAFRDLKERYIVIDYDPSAIDAMEEEGIHHAYGDSTDEEFLDELNVPRAKLVVSTMTDFTTNSTLLHYIRTANPQTSFICHANNLDEAEKLYEAGASYVTLPHYIGSERVSGFIKRHGYDQELLNNYRNKHAITLGHQALKP
jgi:FlaA1/EpsC-like NDP-sugar epimerase